MSPRTLQRRLDEHEVSFRELQSAARLRDAYRLSAGFPAARGGDRGEARLRRGGQLQQRLPALDRGEPQPVSP